MGGATGLQYLGREYMSISEYPITHYCVCDQPLIEYDKETDQNFCGNCTGVIRMIESELTKGEMDFEENKDDKKD